MRALKISLLVFILSITISAQWYQQNSGTNNELRTVNFFNNNFGCVGGWNTLLKSEDMGTIWEQINIDDSLYLLSIDLISSTTGWFVAYKEEYSKIYKTTNSGSSWFLQYTSQFASGLSYIQFIDENIGWCVGSGSLGAGKAIKTTDGGNTWINVVIDPSNYYSLESVFFLNGSIGWVAGNRIYKTTDGGSTWISQFEFTGENVYVIQFIDSNTGWAGSNIYSGNFIYKTTNSGTTWIQQSTLSFNWFNFIDQLKGWATIGHNIYSTTNGGNNWILQSSNTTNNLYQIFFVNQNSGWAVGNNGTILYTPNGGIPVELISFKAEILESKVGLIWSTATETNNFGFEILRFAQNDKWNKIGFVPGHGTTAETQNYTFTDNDVRPGKYQYKLKQIDYDGTFEYSQIVEVEISFVNKFSLSQNYPNPFNPVTKIKYSIPSVTLRQAQSDIRVTLLVYDLLGREIATLVNEVKPAGEYEVEFNGSTLPSGIYFYQLKAGQFVETRQMVLMK